MVCMRSLPSLNEDIASRNVLLDMDVEQKEIEMFVAGLVLDPSTNAPIVVLKDASGEICLPIWIGMAEANSIASCLKRMELSRPMTHDLLKNIIDDFNGLVVKVIITELRDNTFFANIEIRVGDTLKTIDSRPSDAIALAVRTNAQITVREAVLAQAKVTLVAVDPEETEEFELKPDEQESESQNFANIDKEKWEQILAEMDPDDFKYKM